METKRLFSILFSLPFLVLFLIPDSASAIKLGEITSFQGEVIVLSGVETFRVEKVGHPLNEGDRVQTKEGTVEVTFGDGAILQINPFSSSLIQQKEEEKGFWIFKTKEINRRITCFVGKLSLKSGNEIKQNYLQTPTATAGIRGSEAEVGYDNEKSYLNMLSGEISAQFGEFIKGFFENPGVDAAAKNEVFTAIEKAAEQKQKAEEKGDTVELARAELATLQAIAAAAKELARNADPVVAEEARQALTEIQTLIEQKETQISEVEATTTEGEETTTIEATTTSEEEATTTEAVLTTTTTTSTTTTTTTVYGS